MDDNSTSPRPVRPARETWWRRHRAPVIATGLVLTALTAGLGGLANADAASGGPARPSIERAAPASTTTPRTPEALAGSARPPAAAGTTAAPTTAPAASPTTASAPATTAAAAVPASPVVPATPVAPTPAPALAPAAAGLTVTHVVDGDTVDLSTGQRVRLIGIDTPELGECGFEAAARRMEQLVLHQPVVVRPGARDDIDRYGRLLRYVASPLTPDAGTTLLNEGLAVARYDSRDGYGAHTYQSAYVAADDAAANTCTPAAATTTKPATPKPATTAPKPATPKPTPAPTTAAPKPASATVHPGAFCAPVGARGVTVKGTPMVCGPASDGRNRWHSG